MTAPETERRMGESTRHCWEQLGLMRERLVELQDAAADLEDPHVSGLLAKALRLNADTMRFAAETLRAEAQQ